jgi:acid ceramidase
MSRFLLVLCLATAALAAEKTCHWASWSYPPPADKSPPIPWVDVNLDTPPQDRWTHIVTPWKNGMQAVINQVLSLLKPKTAAVIEKIINMDETRILERFGGEYGQELKGISTATGIDLAWVTVMNFVYEITGMCTSIVAQDNMGNILHARNLDFGVFDGYNFHNDTWDLTNKLREVLFNARVYKGGKLLYNMTSFAGYLGLLTGSKQGAFSLSVDSRFDANLDRYLLEWLDGKWMGQELTLFLRNVITNTTTYDQALTQIQNQMLVGPAYIIIAGISPGQGAVVTRSAATLVDTWTLESRLTAGTFYLLETNYDHWKGVPFFDDRRTPGMRCMNETGQANINFPTLYNVLSSKPSRNQLTTQTILMSPTTGFYEGYKQFCEKDCVPW